MFLSGNQTFMEAINISRSVSAQRESIFLILNRDLSCKKNRLDNQSSKLMFWTQKQEVDSGFRTLSKNELQQIL